MKIRLLAAVVAACLGMPAAHAAIIPVNDDDPGVGLNDPTPRAPEGGNPGTTVGDQRKIVYQYAADQWGSVLTSDIDVHVGASFASLDCDAGSAVLGSAGATTIYWDNSFPLQGTWYHIALADQLAGVDLIGDGVTPEIASQFNSDLGQTGCLEGSGWYYGLDGNTPAGMISFLDVVMHEISHGLGFSGFLNKNTGALGNYDGTPRPDVYTHFAYDNLTGARFDDGAMTDPLRRVAMKTPGRTSWDGPIGKAQTPAFLNQTYTLGITGSITATFPAYGTASFGAAATSANFDGDVVIVNDGVGPDTADACEPLTAGSLTGKVAFINRGVCGFEFKARNAQGAGASAVIIGNVASSGTPGTAPGMADDPTITDTTVPTVSLNLANADTIRTQATGMHAALGAVAGQYVGSDSGGRPLLYTPTQVAGGSTFSHFDTTLTPNALMEPFINDDLAANFDTDLTASVFADEGWVLKSGTAKLGSKACDTKVPLYTAPGIMTGANLQAADTLCTAAYPTTTGRKSCITSFAAKLKAAGLITSTQQTAITTCALRP
ncbi:serine protease [Pseudoluteimonas lycopersici]|uniref:Serine protease n=1 Tax=Pseudoluteimonas lycopersici TaxID=1324796 RepID=A0A516V6P9_9GAMM|nr:PA domain-containing protein [Lysobacter lycopersici]QDQ74183.1 serine protease [Lysobacter lycopersici]